MHSLEKEEHKKGCVGTNGLYPILSSELVDTEGSAESITNLLFLPEVQP